MRTPVQSPVHLKHGVCWAKGARGESTPGWAAVLPRPPGPSRGEREAAGPSGPRPRSDSAPRPPASPTPERVSRLRPTPPDPSYPAASPPRTARGSGAFSRPRLLPASPARATEHVTDGGAGRACACVRTTAVELVQPLVRDGAYPAGGRSSGLLSADDCSGSRRVPQGGDAHSRGWAQCWPLRTGAE